MKKSFNTYKKEIKNKNDWKSLKELRIARTVWTVNICQKSTCYIICTRLKLYLKYILPDIPSRKKSKLKDKKRKIKFIN